MVLAILVAVIVFAVAFMPASSISRNQVDRNDGFRNGDYFIYDATGTYDNTSIAGSYNLTIKEVGKGAIGGYQGLNSNLPELDSLMNRIDGLSLMSFVGQEIGTGKVNTSFGVKEVKQEFQGKDGWAAIGYVGSNPQVLYGCAVNGPSFHLDLRLSKTNNTFAIANNTASITPLTREDQQSGPGTPTYYPGQNGTLWMTFYYSKGAHLHFNITAVDTNVYGFSEANMLSMAENGPYAYDLAVTRLHVANETVDTILPPGYYILIIIGHEAENRTGRLDYKVSSY
jgi:hypothetical protein